MKTSMYGILLLTCILFISSCGDDKVHTMYTRIKPDGSCYREFTKKGDSLFMVGDTSVNPFLVLLDSTWNITYSFGPDSLPDKFITGWPIKVCNMKADSIHHLLVRATRCYKSVDEMASTFTFNHCPWSHKIKQDFYLNKKFRWFYTYYEFRETFKKINPNPETKITDFLNEEEIAHYFGENSDFTKGKNGAESLEYLKELEHKTEHWMEKCMYSAYFDVIVKNFNLFSKLNMDSTKFRSLEDSVFKFLKEKNSLENDSIFFFSLDSYFKSKIFREVYKKDTVFTKELNDAGKKSALGYFIGELRYNLSVPGKILKTNSVAVIGDTLSWKVDANRFLFNDYSIYVKSRKPNTWAFVVTAILILAAIGSFWVRKK